MNKVSQNDNNLKELTNISQKNIIIICNYNDRNNLYQEKTEVCEVCKPVN